MAKGLNLNDDEEGVKEILQRRTHPHIEEKKTEEIKSEHKGAVPKKKNP